jgi:hypothetical protein
VADNQLVKKGDTLLMENDLRTMSKKVILSPFDGQVFVTKGYKNNAEKQTIWVSRKITGYNVVFLLSNNQSGKVQVGQKAQISLNEYPRNEFGYLEGTISSVIPVKIEGAYRAYVSLSNKTTTNTGYVIPDQASFSGTAEILTNERSVFRRIFSY